MTKKEVEKNEEGLFKKWLDQADDIVHDWCNPLTDTPSAVDEDETRLGQASMNLKMPRAPTSFERNLEVWRQLWRVSEISQIILILLDSRCPLLHFPPSLSAYLSSPHIANRTRTILVLTKVDITGPTRTNEWTRFLRTKYPRMPVVRVESYAEIGETPAGKGRPHQPRIPLQFRQSLVQALREMHAELLEPPVRLRDHPERLTNWRPPVRQSISWDAVLNAHGGQVGTVVGGAAAPRSNPAPYGEDPNADLEDGEENGPETEPEYLTVGLIGQPNVGKSSLLNALFGIPKVKASRTPGKTKHFQTLFWTPEVRLVDCPGLVMPNLVPMETQVLGGILPISRVSAIPLCIYHAAQLLPLETVFNLTHPSFSEPQLEDKRTWREPRVDPATTRTVESVKWTAMDILTAYALKKGWVTAKAGRPDVMRAGNAILRLLAEGKIAWGFWPEGTPQAVLDSPIKTGHGIWIPNDDDASTLVDGDETDDEEEEAESATEDEDSTLIESDSEDEKEVPNVVVASNSRFAALTLTAQNDSDSDEDSDGSESKAQR